MNLQLDPFVDLNNQSKTLIVKLLAVPELRARYVGYVKEIATKWLDWNRLGPIANQLHQLVADDAAKDTRKLYSTDAFNKSLTEDTAIGGIVGTSVGLKKFADTRRSYLLNYQPPANAQ